MSLTAGATLQNGKYLIQSVLHRTDASVSYQATHTSLNHPVVIHTLNPSLQQSPRFDFLRQQFLATVKQGGLKEAIVRDCFEEDNLPYVVIEPTPTPLKLTDSMPFLTAVLSAPAANSKPAAPIATAAIASPFASITPPQPLPSAPQTAPQLPVLPANEGSANAIAPAPQPAPVRLRARRWLPVALLLTAATAGLTGAAIGWKLRHSPSSPSTPALFSREQSFPERTDWLGEDPYADSNSDEQTLDSASPAIERRSTARRQRAIEPEPEYYAPQPRSRSRRTEQFSPAQPDLPPSEPQVEPKPAVEAPKVETFPDPIPQPEAPPPAAAPVVPEPAPPAAIEPSPKEQLAPPAASVSQ